MSLSIFIDRACASISVSVKGMTKVTVLVLLLVHSYYDARVKVQLEVQPKTLSSGTFW